MERLASVLINARIIFACIDCSWPTSWNTEEVVGIDDFAASVSLKQNYYGYCTKGVPCCVSDCLLLRIVDGEINLVEGHQNFWHSSEAEMIVWFFKELLMATG